MTLYRGAVKQQGVIRASALKTAVGRKVRIAGMLITGKSVYTKSGDPMQFLTFEDESGLVETTFFPEAYRRFCAIMERNRPYVVSGLVEMDFGAVTLTASSAVPLEAARMPPGRTIGGQRRARETGGGETFAPSPLR
jgi:DNA polymerase-3 subunit alpha/error-prone DNA polymerase